MFFATYLVIFNTAIDFTKPPSKEHLVSSFTSRCKIPLIIKDRKLEVLSGEEGEESEAFLFIYGSLVFWLLVL